MRLRQPLLILCGLALTALVSRPAAAADLVTLQSQVTGQAARLAGAAPTFGHFQPWGGYYGYGWHGHYRPWNYGYVYNGYYGGPNFATPAAPFTPGYYQPLGDNGYAYAPGGYYRPLPYYTSGLTLHGGGIGQPVYGLPGAYYYKHSQTYFGGYRFGYPAYGHGGMPAFAGEYLPYTYAGPSTYVPPYTGGFAVYGYGNMGSCW